MCVWNLFVFKTPNPWLIVAVGREESIQRKIKEECAFVFWLQGCLGPYHHQGQCKEKSSIVQSPTLFSIILFVVSILSTLTCGKALTVKGEIPWVRVSKRGSLEIIGTDPQNSHRIGHCLLNVSIAWLSFSLQNWYVTFCFPLFNEISAG